MGIAQVGNLVVSHPEVKDNHLEYLGQSTSAEANCCPKAAGCEAAAALFYPRSPGTDPPCKAWHAVQCIGARQSLPVSCRTLAPSPTVASHAWEAQGRQDLQIT